MITWRKPLPAIVEILGADSWRASIAWHDPHFDAVSLPWTLGTRLQECTGLRFPRRTPKVTLKPANRITPNVINNSNKLGPFHRKFNLCLLPVAGANKIIY
jgi:hypothetical protein